MIWKSAICLTTIENCSTTLYGIRTICIRLPSIFFITLILTQSAHANPENGVVVSGDASILTQGNNVQITQNSDQAIINWSSFNIAPNQQTHFQQPPSGVILNRIDAKNGVSEVLGSLSATGTLVLVNSAGILFGKDAQVNVGSLIASTADISNQNFMQGKYIFDNAGMPSASIVNLGKIIAKDYGLVALMGQKVRNDGLILAKLGRVKFASGDKFNLDLHGDELISFAVNNDSKINPSLGLINTGIINAQGGNVLITAQVASEILDKSVNLNDIEIANSVKQQSSEIVFYNDTEISGQIDVSNNDGHGGSISIQAKQVALSKDAKLNASGTTSGGSVIVKSKHSTTSYGEILARASVDGATGGLIELSSFGNVDFTDSINDTRVLRDGKEVGTVGNFIIDPKNIIVQTSGGSAYSAGVNNLFANNVGATTTLTPASIVSAAVASNITLQANTDITVVDAVIIPTTSRTVTMQAGRSVFIQNTVSVGSGGTIAITANDNTATSGDRTAGVGDIAFSSTGTLSSLAGSTTLNIGTSSSAPFSPGSITYSGSGDLNGGSVTISAASSAVALPPTTITSNLSVTAGGAITQGGILTVTGTSSFIAGANPITLTQNNALTGTVTLSNSGANPVSLTNSIATALGSSTVGSTLAITSGGSITQSAALTATGGAVTASVTAANSDILLTANNNMSNAIIFGGTLTNIRDVTFRNANASATLPNFAGLSNLRNLTIMFPSTPVPLPGITLTNGGNISVSSGNAITQSGPLVVPGTSTFVSAGGAGINLTQNNTLTGSILFNSITFTSTSITNSIATVLGNSTSTGTFTLVSGGSVTQTGSLSVGSGNINISLTAPNSDILLINAANSLGANSPTFSGTLANIRDVSLRKNNANAALPSFAGLTNLRDLTINYPNAGIAFPAFTLTNGGNLSATAGGAISQSAAITVPGTSSFSTTAFPINLPQNNSLTGAISFSNSGANDVSITNSIATLLGASTLGRNLTVASSGAITQNSALTVPGTASFSAGANSIALTQANAFTGAVTLSNSGANDISLTNSIATILAASSLGRNLSVSSSGGISQSGILTVPGESSFSAGTNPITLTQTNNAFTGAVSLSNSGANAVSLTNSIATALGTSTIGSTLAITSGGTISQTGPLTATGGAVTTSVTVPNTDIFLTNTNNNLGAFTPAFGGTLANIRDVGLTNTNASAAMPNFSGLTSLRNLTIIFQNSGMTFPTLTLTNGGNFAATAGGTITQNGTMTVPGTANFTASANLITTANLITGGTTTMIGDNATGAINVPNLTLDTNLANLNGSINGLVDQSALAFITNLNFIAPNTHFFNGFDMYNTTIGPVATTSEILTSQLRTLIANTLFVENNYFNSPNMRTLEKVYADMTDSKIYTMKIITRKTRLQPKPKDHQATTENTPQSIKTVHTDDDSTPIHISINTSEGKSSTESESTLTSTINSIFKNIAEIMFVLFDKAISAI